MFLEHFMSSGGIQNLCLHFKLNLPYVQAELTDHILNVITPAHGSKEGKSQLELRFLSVLPDH